MAATANGQSTNCDCAAIGPLPSGTATNRVFINGNALRTFDHTEYTTKNQYHCQSGASSYRIYGHIECGTYTAVNGTCTIGLETGGNFTLQHCDISTATVSSGDSGAPVIIDTGFANIVSGGGGSGGGLFSKASYVGTVNLVAFP